MSSYTQEVFCSISLDKSSVEFEFGTDRNLYLNMRDTHLSLKLHLFKERLFGAFKKEKSRTKNKVRERCKQGFRSLINLCEQTTIFTFLQL